MSKQGAIFVDDPVQVRQPSLARRLLTGAGPLPVPEAREYPSVYGTLDDAGYCLNAGLAAANAAGDRVISSDIIQRNNNYKVRIVTEGAGAMPKPTVADPPLRTARKGGGYLYGFCCSAEHGTLLRESELRAMRPCPYVMCGRCARAMRPCSHAKHLTGTPGPVLLTRNRRPVQTVRDALAVFGVQWRDGMDGEE